MLRDGLIPVEGFVTVLSASMEQTLLPGLVTAENITDFFGEYDQWQASDIGSPKPPCFTERGLNILLYSECRWSGRAATLLHAMCCFISAALVSLALACGMVA